MIVEDQSEVRAFLVGPETLGQSGPVEVIETHISIIFLAGDRAYKLKRAVRYPYVDFSTPELRQTFCEREVERNGRTASEHYLATRRITREVDGSLAFEGEGALVDAVVEMRRFEQAALFDAMAASGSLNRKLMEDLARAIADFHSEAPVVTGSGSDHVAGVLDVNEAALKGTQVLDPAEVAAFNTRFRTALEQHRALLDHRGADGRVRLCHGDLHLRNIFLHEGRPVLFDCIEFNDAIATVDVLYDLAFLLMDLQHRSLSGFANLVMNRYLDVTEEECGLPLLPFFMALRATVRAHVTATRIDNGSDPDGRLTAEARVYFSAALELLRPEPAQIVAIAGLSGSGKSTVAEALAPLIPGGAGARILSSDRIRKAFHRVAPEVRLPPEAYAPEVSERVYAAMTTRATSLAAAGQSVLVDAVFARESERHHIAESARTSGVPFLGIWLELPPQTLRRRIEARRGGPSDATVAVLERQLGYDLGEVDWRRLDAGQAPDTTAAAILDLIRRTRPSAAEIR